MISPTVVGEVENFVVGLAQPAAYSIVGSAVLGFAIQLMVEAG